MEVHGRRIGFAPHFGGEPLNTRGEVLGAVGDVGEHRLDNRVVRVADVQPEVHGRGDDVRPAGVNVRPADRGDRTAVRPGDLRNPADDRTCRGNRVSPVAHRSCSGVVALPREPEVPAAVADDRTADRHRLVGVDEPHALFDVQLDERSDLVQAVAVSSDVLRCEAVGAGRLRERHAFGVFECQSAVTVDGPR